MSQSLSSLLGSQGTAMAIQNIYQHLAPGVVHFNDIVVKKGLGSWVWTSDGEKYLDITSGIGATSTGHCHPKVTAAVQKQAGEIVHAQQSVFGAHDKLVELVDKLLPIVPSNLKRFFFCNSGSEAVENAIKIARAYTGRPNIIAFDGGFHGRTLGCISVTTSKNVYRTNFGPLLPNVCISPFPYCLHCKARQAAKQPIDNFTCCDSVIEGLEMLLKMQSTPSDTAAIIIEGILGEGGFVSPTPSLMKAIRKICDEHDIMLIVDEVQSGAGRTGKWWAMDHFPNVKPDMILFAKGIGSGYPVAGLVAKDNAFRGCEVGSLGGTYGGNAVALAAACATVDVIHEEGLIANTIERGKQLQAGLKSLQGKYPISEVRGRGLMLATEFGGPDGSLKATKGCASAVTKAAAKRKMLLLTAGARETVRFLPPLNVKADEINIALDTFEKCLKEVFKN